MKAVGDIRRSIASALRPTDTHSYTCVQKRMISVMSTINVSTARQTLPAQLDRVEGGEEVAITRHGRVVAVLVRPDALRARRAPEAWSRADHIGSRLESARREPRRPPALSPERAEELVEAVRVERSTR